LAVILPDSSAATIRDDRDLAEALREAFPGDASGSPGSILAREFDEAFWSGFAPAVDYVTAARVPDSVPPAPADRRVGLTVPASYGSPAHAYSAPDSAWLAEHGAAADLVLALGPLVVAKESEQIDAYQFGGSIKINRLALQGWYLLWDYGARKAVAQGKFRSKVEYRGQPKPRDWMKAFDEAMQSVGEGTPFRGPKWYRR
jgi:hypothetical protein